MLQMVFVLPNVLFFLQAELLQIQNASPLFFTSNDIFFFTVMLQMVFVISNVLFFCRQSSTPNEI
jgi:hypothetical protein